MRLLLVTALLAIGTLGLVQRLGTPAAAAGSPRIVGARMQDLDRDGKADHLLLTYSKAIRFGGHTGPGNSFGVPGYVVLEAQAVSGASRLGLVLAEKGRPDPNAAPDVTYRATACAGDRVVDLAGNRAPDQVFRGTQPVPGRPGTGNQAAPPATPRIVRAQMQDGNADGKSDGVLLTFSKRVTYIGETEKSVRFKVAGYRVTGVTSAKRSLTLTVLVAEKGAPDPKAKPDVAYCGPDPAASPGRQGPTVRDVAGHAAPSQDFTETEARTTGSPTTTVVATGKYSDTRPGTKLQCSGAFLNSGGSRISGTVEATGRTTCRATFTKVPLGVTARVSILGTWLPRTPVGGCNDYEIKDPVGGVVTLKSNLPLTADGFAKCIIP